MEFESARNKQEGLYSGKGEGGGGLITGLKKCFKLSYIIGASQNTFMNLIKTNVVKSHPFQDKLQGGKYLGGGGGGVGLNVI